MATYGTNIIPSYTSWSMNGSITATTLQLSSSANGAYAQLSYSQSGVTIGNTAQVITSGCTGNWYLIIYFFATDGTKQVAFSIKVPTEAHTFTLQLPSLAVGNLYARVVHRGSSSGTCGLFTFQYEQAAETNAGYIDPSTVSATGSRTFHSLPDGSASVIKLANMYYTREVTIATLAVAFDPRLVSANKSVSIYVEGAAVINYATGVTASHTMDIYVRMYFGDRMLTQRIYTLSRPYEEVEIPISASLHVSVLSAEDIWQNIPLKITVSRGAAATQSNNILAINTQQSFIAATGPLLLNEHRGELSILNTNVSSFANGLMSICPVYPSAGSRWPSGVYYTTPTTPCTVVYMQRTNDYIESDQAAVYPGRIDRVFESTVKKVRIVSVTEIFNIASNEVQVKQGSTRYYVVLTTSNQLQVRNIDNSILYTIATGVVDFDTTLCGLYGVGADETTLYEALFMKRIVGFTVFYTTGSALYVASYPKWNVDVTNLDTTPTLAAMGIYTIDKGNLGTLTQIAVSALYQVAVVVRSDGTSTALGTNFVCWSLQFGLTAHLSTNAIIHARIAIDIPAATTNSAHPTISKINTPRFQVRNSVPDQRTPIVPTAGYNTDVVSVSGTIPLGKMLSTAIGSLSLSYIDHTHAEIEPVGNTYIDSWYEFMREYTHSHLIQIFSTMTTNSHFMPSSAPYTKFVSSTSNYQEEYIVDMLPSGDASYFYFGKSNAYSYSGSSSTSFIAHFIKGLLPRINHFWGIGYPADAYRLSNPSASTLSLDTTNQRYVLLYVDSNEAPINKVQCSISRERMAYSTANTTNVTYYQYCNVGITQYISGDNYSSSSYLTAYISEISPWKNTGLRYPMQNDFYYTGWMPIKL